MMIKVTTETNYYKLNPCIEPSTHNSWTGLEFLGFLFQTRSFYYKPWSYELHTATGTKSH